MQIKRACDHSVTVHRAPVAVFANAFSAHTGLSRSYFDVAEGIWKEYFFDFDSPLLPEFVDINSSM